MKNKYFIWDIILGIVGILIFLWCMSALFVFGSRAAFGFFASLYIGSAAAVLIPDVIVWIIIKSLKKPASLIKIHTIIGIIIIAVMSAVCWAVILFARNWDVFIGLLAFVYAVPFVPLTMIAAYFLHRIKSRRTELQTIRKEL